MDYIYLNGTFVTSSEAKISAFDQGFLYGDGIFESFRSAGESLYQFPQHYRRLQQSADALNYPPILSRQELEKVLLELRTRNGLQDAYYRITISRGPGEIGFQRMLGGDLTTLVIGREFRGFDAGLYEKGIALHVAQTRRNAPEAINPKIKSISNLNSLLGKLEAKAAGVPEVIMLNNRGHVCEGSASNIFWTKGAWVFTPDASTGLLEGVTRATIMRLCEEQLGLRVVSGEYRLQDLKCAEEVFVTSTSLEVMPVVKIDDFTIHRGTVGTIARALREALHRDMGKST